MFPQSLRLFRRAGRELSAALASGASYDGARLRSDERAIFLLEGRMPSGWVEFSLSIGLAQDGPGHARVIAETEAGQQTVPLELRRDGRAEGVARLPALVRGLRLQIDRPGTLDPPAVRVRELAPAEGVARMAAPFLRKRLSEPWLFPLMALKLARALRAGGPAKVLDLLLEKRPHLSRVPYAEWVARYSALSDADRAAIRREIERLQLRPRISVLMPVYEAPEPFLRRAIESVRAQLYPDWELCIADDASPSPHVRRVLEEAAAADPRIRLVFRDRNGHISAASNSALGIATGDWIALLDHDDELSEHALYMVAAAAADADLVYSDEDKVDAEGRLSDPHFKPDWNPDLLLAQNYVAHLCAARTGLVRGLGGFRLGLEGSQDHDLVLRIAKAGGRIRHVPHVLYHWRAVEGSTALSAGSKRYAEEASLRALRDHTGVAVEAGPLPFTYRVRWPVPQPAPLVSLIVPTRDAPGLLQTFVETLATTAYRPWELIVVDNQSRDPAALRLLRGLEERKLARVLRYDAPFNYSAINNLGVREARGEIVGLLNNDLEIVEPGWLTAMVAQALRPEVGAVGARLLYPDGTVQHGGVILGIGGVANHAHRNFPRNETGYFGRLQLVQNLSAVTAACLLVRRDVYLRAGGLDEDIAVAFNDVDFCLRLGKAGLRCVFTPDATLVHHESRSRGKDDSPEKRARFVREVETMTARWGEVLRNDPAYNPNLTLESEDFALAWPPRARKPWEPTG
ncbi:MAG: glycosyltransferase family 2 protein [Deltaproteobacteria bacterium]